MKGYIYADIYNRFETYIEEIKEYFKIKKTDTAEEKTLYPYKLITVRFNGTEEVLGSGFFDDIYPFYDEDEHKSYFSIVVKDIFAFKYDAEKIKKIEIINKQMKIYI